MNISQKILANSRLLTRYFVGIACVLVLPNLLFGVRHAHDIYYHLVLFQSYAEAFQSGILYPRWLPDQMHGLGSPALIFYPPLSSAFFVLLDLVTLHALAPERLLGLGAVLLSAASAFTFFLWAKKSSRSPIVLIAALFYATAPYHLNMDLYARGAMAEYAAFIWIPLIFLGIRKTVHEGSVNGYAFLLGGISAMLLTHLLTAMLIAPVALAYLLVCLWNIRQVPHGLKMRRLFLASAAIILGAALSAFYYVPAISLLSEANPIGLDREVAASNIFFAFSMPEIGLKVRLLVISCSYLIFIIYIFTEIIIAWRKKRLLNDSMSLSLMWIASGLLCFALMSGAFPVVFRPPSPYANVQFSWRLLVVLEFSLASLLVNMYYTINDGVSLRRLMKVAMAGLFLLTVMQMLDIVARFRNHPMFENPLQASAEVKLRLAPIEYFPSGTAIAPSNIAIKPFEEYAAASTPAFVDSTKGKIVSASRTGSTFLVRSLTKEATPVMIQQFYFPGWKASDENANEISVFKTSEIPLATYIAPPGDHIVTIERRLTRQEILGNSVSIGALIGVFLSLGSLLYRRGRNRSGFKPGRRLNRGPLTDDLLRKAEPAEW